MPTATAGKSTVDDGRIGHHGHSGAVRRTAGEWLGRARARAAAPVAADAAAVFRIGFGLLVAVSAVRFLANGWVDTLYLEPTNHLTYAGFEWIRPFPAPLMHLVFACLAVLGLCIAAGYRHRLATVLFLLVFGYTELVEASLYLNHYWFLTLTALLLLVLPVNNHWASDARSGRVVASATVSALVVWALRAQVGAVYVFAGVAKVNTDWLLHAQPLQLWFVDRSATPVVGQLLAVPATAYVASWAAACFDLTVAGWLLWSRSRPLAYGTLVVFHAATGLLFQIGVFPLVMIVAATVFFDPDWPTRLWRRLVRQGAPEATPVTLAAHRSWPGSPSRRSIAVLFLIAVMQLLVPLRHYAYPGNVRWTEEGYYLAWRVMLTDKAGHVRYLVTDPVDGRSWETGPELVLTDWQASHAATRPDLIHATAHLIAERYRAEGYGDLEVRAVALVSMNGAEARPIIDPTVDLAAEPRNLAPSSWILSRGESGG